MAGAALLLAAAPLSAATTFDEFTPLPSSVAAGSLPEATPLVLGNSQWRQRTVADRTTQLAAGQFNSGAWDMNTLNESGPDAGRYLFTVYETAQSGIQRLDRRTGAAQTIWQSPAAAPALTSHVAFDASYWTPWGSFVTAEESWGAQPQPYGRFFELTNPLAANGATNLAHRNIIARVSHEGVQFDAQKSMYYIDELNGGSIYKFVSDNPNAATGDAYFAAGTNHVLRVGDGNTDNATGASAWVAFSDENGAFAGGVNITDPNGVTSADGRATTDLAAFKGTNYQRPEDLQVQTLANGDQLMYVATTTTNEVYSINLTTGEVKLFVSRLTLDAATGLAVGNSLTSPDNLAIDADGNIYIVEDQPGGVDDIWFARDADRDGVAESISRWATMSTVGAEMTGLYFDPFNANVAYVNIQHPSSGVDRTIAITIVPEPATLAVPALLAILALRRRARA